MERSNSKDRQTKDGEGNNNMTKGNRALILRRLSRAHKHTARIGSYLVWIMNEFKRAGREHDIPKPVTEAAALCMALDDKLSEAERSI